MNTAAARSQKISWTQKGVALRFRRRFPSVDFAFSGIDGFVRHRTGRSAALMAHYGFISVFPLLIAMTTILGLVLQNRPDLQKRIIDSTLANIPIVGETIGTNPDALTGSVVVLVLGLATTLWAGTKAFVAAQWGMNDIWEVPEVDRPTLAKSRGRSFLGILIVGVAQIGTAIITGIIGVSGVSWTSRILLAVAAFAINIAMLVAVYQVLTARKLNRSQLLPGAIGAGFGFSVLQVLTGTIVARAILRATPVYGSFAAVIALLAWLSLHSMVALVGVEANAALDRRRNATPTPSLE